MKDTKKRHTYGSQLAKSNPQGKTGAELSHNHTGDNLGMDIGLAFPEEGETGAELNNNNGVDNMDVDLEVAISEGGGNVAELGHNHEVDTVKVNLVIALPGAGKEEVGWRGDGQDDGAVRREVQRLEDGGGRSSTLTTFGVAKCSKFVKPRGRRGVKKDSLIQTRIESLFSLEGNREIVGLGKAVGNGKRKFMADMNNPNGAKRSKTLSGWSTSLSE